MNCLYSITYGLYIRKNFILMRAEGLVFFLQHLYTSFEEESGFLQFATSITSNDVEEIWKFLDKAVDARSSLILLL